MNYEFPVLIKTTKLKYNRFCERTALSQNLLSSMTKLWTVMAVDYCNLLLILMLELRKV